MSMSLSLYFVILGKSLPCDVYFLICEDVYALQQGILISLTRVIGKGVLRDLSSSLPVQETQENQEAAAQFVRGRDSAWLTGSLGGEGDPFRLTGSEGSWQEFPFPETGTYICKLSSHVTARALRGKRRASGAFVQTPLSPLFLSLSEVLPVVTCTCIVPPMRWQYIILPKVIPYNFTSTVMSQDFSNRFIAKLDILGINITPSLSLLSASFFQSPSMAFLAINFIFLLSFYIIFYIFCISFLFLLMQNCFIIPLILAVFFHPEL